jgi:hypothetical protein
LELARNLRILQEHDLVEVGRIEKLVSVNTPVKADSLTATDSFIAAEAGFVYQLSKDSKELVLSKRQQVPVLRFAPNAIGTPEHEAVARLLDLDPETNVYEFNSALEGFLKEYDEKKTTIDIGMRSILEMMFLLSKGVQVPKSHLTNNLAPSDDFEVNWHEVLAGFQIHCCNERPECASLAIMHRNCWFYIDDRDQNSKATFLLLRLIFDTQVQGGGAENLPVLTLPL